MTLLDAITTYVTLKQAMGMRFHSAHRILRAFHRQAGDVDVAAVSPEVITAFLRPRGPLTATWLHKQRTLRLFFQHWIARGIAVEMPVPVATPRIRSTFVPHIYSDEELRRLLAGIDAHHARGPRTIAPPTFRALLLLLYGAGLRLGEAVALQHGDVDLRAGMILIRDTKFYKSRALPIGPRLTQVLAEYVETVPTDDRARPTAFFMHRRGGRLSIHTVWHNFDALRNRVGVQGRLHDLRHTFAVHRLLAWYREGADVRRCLPHLSTYLGHARIACTQHYLTMIPELLEHASRRFEAYTQAEARHE